MEKIAMKCTSIQFDNIEKDLINGGFIIYGITDFERCDYLCTNAWGNKEKISNFKTPDISNFGRKIYETFDKDIFLKSCGIKVKKDKKTTMFKKAIKLIKALDNEHCNITYIGTDSGYALNAQGDNELDGSFTITITGNKTK